MVRGRQILSYGFRRKLIKDREWEISAIYDTLFGSRSENIAGSALFCNYFPDVQDFALIVAVGISQLYFFGKINDQESVRLANSLAEASISLEIIRLER